MTLLIVLAILATWRVSSLFAEEEGPGEVFTRIRMRVTGKIIGQKGASCVWCLSIYISAFFAALIFPYLTSPWYEFFVYWLGLSAGAIIVHSTLQWLIGGRR